MLEKADDIIIAEKIKEITLLLNKHLKGELTSDEQKKLDAWVNESEQNRLVFEKISNEEVITGQVKEYYNLLPQIEELRKRHAAETARVVDMFSKKTTTWPRWVAAASVILLIATGTYYFLTPQKTAEVATNTNPTPVLQDIPPAGNRAVLTLSNGSRIILDSAGIGTIAQQEKTTINKIHDGELVYESSHSLLTTHHSPLTYNTVSTPRGGKYQLLLPDGSKVWLNAASSLRFPIAFTGNERKVELTGEAYFEIAHDISKPFKVAMIPSSAGENKGEIMVLGTHFNANAYEEETDIKVTLFEGSVKISKKISPDKTPIVKFIKPGQQATFNKDPNKGIDVINKRNAESEIAWVNGKFSFDNIDFASMMREFSRWYDVDVVYEGAVPENTAVGEISLKMQLSDLLGLLGQMGKTRFILEGRTVKVIP